MRKRKAFILAAVFVALAVAVNSLLNYLLVQPGLSRTIFYECRQNNNECVILGASHGSYGLSTEEIEKALGKTTLNMCMGGEYMCDAYYVLKYAVKHNSLKAVILDIDYQYLINHHDESILFNNIYNAYPNSPGKLGYFWAKMAREEYRGTFLRWTNYWQCYYMIDRTVAKKRSEAYKKYAADVVNMNPYDTYKGKGFIYRSSDYKKSETSCLEWNAQKVDRDECNYIRKIAKLCKENQIQLIFTTVCQDPETIASQAEKFAGADRFIRALAEELNVPYLNFNSLKFNVFDRSAADFYDKEGHMYGETARRFSEIYGRAVQETLAGTCKEEQYFRTDICSLYQEWLAEHLNKK